MIIAWLTIGLFLLVLPLAAWWLGGRSALDLPNVAAEGEALARAVAREHGLTTAQAALVGRAVRWGRTVEEPALRPVAVEWAQRLMALDRRRRAARPRLRGWLVVLLVTWASLVVGRVVLAVAQGRWSDVNWLTVALYTAAAVAGWRLRTGPQRAVERNGAPAS
ncbi:hypothetical protein GCU67_14985 [Modestobacter muralis]|uniref:Uncharacterized protein n=1 Tax=Modestobacter muralis TaxID=1608614 RepID=A0A6P0EX21_9ACTN|nr:hypothetical protein [Modestobacter muralis]NEK95460.1 hypothetical protein [Modestobacter muralis]NEN52348.1 hypothetical protein [Modestobacter muralis]